LGVLGVPNLVARHDATSRSRARGNETSRARDALMLNRTVFSFADKRYFYHHMRSYGQFGR
jgi:hypothetical protein